MKVLTLVALLCMVALANAATCIDTDPSQGVQYAQGCSCYSGFTGDDCSVNSLGVCESGLPTVAPLTTETVATMGPSSISNHNFNFVLMAPGRSHRHYIVALNDNMDCAYPGSTSISRTFVSNECGDMFSGQFSLDDVINTCGAFVSAGEFEIELSGTIDVNAFDQLSSFRGVGISRSTHSAVNYLITVPTTATANTSALSVISEMDVLAAVTSQEYNQTEDSFVIELVTSVQYPYILTTEAFDSTTTNFAVLLQRTDKGAQCLQTGPCTQTYEITIEDIQALACEADGSYTFSFMGACRGQGECPGAGETTVSFTLDTESVCSKVELVASLSAELESFSDDSFSTPQTSYLPNARLYFSATVEADVTVISTNVQEVRVVQSGVPQVIVTAGVEVDPAVGFSSSSEGNRADFGFNAVTASSGFYIFDSSVVDAIFSFDVEVDVEVVYDVTFRKRAIQTKTFSVSRHLVLSPETAVLSPKSSLENSASAASFTAGSIVAAAVVGVAALL